MSGNTPVANLRYALLTDPPNANTLSQNLATDLDHLVIPKYATTTARDLANTSPIEGDRCYVTGDGDYQHDGTTWRQLDMVHGWTTWNSPTWSTSTGLHLPAIGNGIYDNRYMIAGKIVFYQFTVAFGSTTTFGTSVANTDNWIWHLPVTADVTSDGDSTFALFFNAATQCTGRGRITSGSQLSINVISGRVDATAITQTGLIDGITPWAWPTSGTIQGGGWYIAA